MTLRALVRCEIVLVEEFFSENEKLVLDFFSWDKINHPSACETPPMMLEITYSNNGGL